MAIALPRPPNPIPPSVPRYDTTGRPERVQVEYENRLHQFFAEVDDAISEEVTGPVPIAPQPINTYTSTRIFGLEDAGAYVRCNFALTGTIAIDMDSNVNLPIGCLIEVEQAGPGALQLGWNQPTVQVFTARTTPIQTTGQYTRMFLRKVAANTWVVF